MAALTAPALGVYMAAPAAAAIRATISTVKSGASAETRLPALSTTNAVTSSARRGSRAVIVATMAECLNETLRSHIFDRGLTPLLGLAEGLAALEAASVVGLRCDPIHAAVKAIGATRLFDEAAAGCVPQSRNPSTRSSMNVRW